MHEGWFRPGCPRVRDTGKHHHVIGVVAPDASHGSAFQPAGGPGEHWSISRGPPNIKTGEGILSRVRRSTESRQQRTLRVAKDVDHEWEAAVDRIEQAPAGGHGNGHRRR